MKKLSYSRRTLPIFAALLLGWACNGKNDDLVIDDQGSTPILFPQEIVLSPLNPMLVDSEPQVAGLIAFPLTARRGDGETPLFPGEVEIVTNIQKIQTPTSEDGGFAAILLAEPVAEFITLTAIDPVTGLRSDPIDLELPKIDENTPPPMPPYDPTTNRGVYVDPGEEDGTLVVIGANAAQPGNEVIIANSNNGQTVTATADNNGNFTAEITGNEGDTLIIIEKDGDRFGPPVTLVAPPNQCPDEEMVVLFGACRFLSPIEPSLVEVPGTRPNPLETDIRNGIVFIGSIFLLTAGEGYEWITPFDVEIPYPSANLPLEGRRNLIDIYFSPTTEATGAWFLRHGTQPGTGTIGTRASQPGFFRVGIPIDRLCSPSIIYPLDGECFPPTRLNACVWLGEILSICGLAACGDGFVNAEAEECDDHNTDPGDGCDGNCSLEGCGDGVLQDKMAETCDDANEDPTDACVHCRDASCGDGFVHTGVELCDEGTANGQAGRCNAECTGVQPSVCGNKIVEPSEACDDGGVTPGDGCNSNCELEICGNGVLDQGERCDEGTQCGQPSGCRCDCSGHKGTECGNGVVEVGEQCDDGGAAPGDGCDENCHSEICGNGILQSGEACDDGNDSNSDACLTTCLFNLCNDGYVYTGVEVCDDAWNCGNPGQCACDCSGKIAEPSCGDGVTDPNEVCDSGTQCGLPLGCECDCMGFVPSVCGNGILEGSETCDDGPTCDLPNGCACDCFGTTPPVCGNGSVEAGEACDDGDTDPCTPICNAYCSGSYPLICGDGTQECAELCDDGNIIPSDGCEPDCTFSNCNPIPCLSGAGETHVGSEAQWPDGFSANGWTPFSNAVFNGGQAYRSSNTSAVLTGSFSTQTASINYYIWILGRRVTTAPQDHSKEITIDGNVIGTYEGLWSGGINGPQWQKVAQITLTSGPHTLGVRGTSGDIQYFDGYAITSNPALDPSVDFTPLTSFNLDDPVLDRVEAGGAPLPICCGNCLVEAGEACDAGDNPAPTNGCDATCVAHYCGDGIVEDSETCDSGVLNGTCGECAIDCSGPHNVCGDGMADCGEICDDGDTDSCTESCNAFCTGPTVNICGDGLNECNESCDDGANNGTMCGGCLADCSGLMLDANGFLQVETGLLGYVCGLRIDHTVACWGNNSHQSGVMEAPNDTFQSISSGGWTACGVRTDNSLVCWGENDFGQASPPSGAFRAVSVGGDFACGLKWDNTLECWGSNEFGQTTPLSGTFLGVSSGGTTACGVLPDNTVACWGGNDYSQTNVPTGAFKSVSAGSSHVCGIRPDDSLVCWGDYNVYGTVTPPPGEFLSVSSGAKAFSCSLRADQTISCWGDNDYGQSTPPTGTFLSVDASFNRACGVNTNHQVVCWGQYMASPPYGRYLSLENLPSFCGVFSDNSLNCWTDSIPPTGSYLLAGVGGNFSCALRTDNAIECWGNNINGQANPPTGFFVSLAVGLGHSCATRTDNTAECWGLDADGQSSPPGDTFLSVLALGMAHSCGIRSDNTVACWGSDADGQSSPPLGNFSSLSAGNDHTCGVRDDGEIICWGLNSYGQANPPNGSYISVFSGRSHNCAIRPDNTLDCWGRNHWGQSNPPVGTFRSGSGGWNDTCGIHMNDTVSCWGSHVVAPERLGQCGNGIAECPEACDHGASNGSGPGFCLADCSGIEP